ncbi:hypothetical protein FN846DRAFT_935856 [Sphaerosporella brunnea]|uniref:SMP domain-containing protein n=1 Tax=Sphaerosporella brunnea TaxID=1250544 RepID=A0A5J5F4R7_9PEZI|nr:hypothetical protein FN846DRAFT_935856 [Sphaerosporella brunnea]
MSGNNNSKPVTKEDASRIQSSQAKGGNGTGTGSFASRAQSAGDKNTNNAPQGGNAGAKK